MRRLEKWLVVANFSTKVWTNQDVDVNDNAMVKSLTNYLRKI